jgi:glutamate/tyrosine decarboxylase-like PLP-dependent enzyme
VRREIVVVCKESAHECNNEIRATCGNESGSARGAILPRRGPKFSSSVNGRTESDEMSYALRMMSPRTPFDPDREEMRRLGYEAVDRIVDHLSTLGEQRVAAPGSGMEFAALVDEPLPVEGKGASDSMRFLFERVVPRMTRVNHPRFHAYIPAPSSFIGAVGEILAAGINPFVGTWLGGATVSALELTAVRWIAELVGYPIEAGGILTSGGSIANLSAIAAARSGAEAKGSFDALRAAIYVSEEGHGSLEKAAAILGFPRSAIRRLPVNDELRLDAGVLERAIEADRAAGAAPFFAAANAGSTNTGTVDPLEEIGAVCRAHGVWFHVDGAYGGFAAITPQGRRLLRGMEHADSLTLDPHKWLYCPMGVGCILVRERAFLGRAFRAHGDYLKDLPAHEVNFLDFGPELSRPARVFPVWMILRSMGERALAAQISEDIRLAALAAKLLAEDPRFEIVREPELSVVAFRLQAREGESESDRARRDTILMERTLASGELMLSTTYVKGRSCLRLAVMNHRTQEADVRRSIRAIGDLAP